MRSRSEELRARNRRIFAISYLVAALLLVVIFVSAPGFRVQPVPSTEVEHVHAAAIPDWPLFGQVLFGPPRIRTTDGPTREEPDARTLEVGRVYNMPSDCKDAFLTESLPISGEVRLHVAATGKADLVEWTESTGSPCVDRFIGQFAAALHYEWLPSDRFPPPVDLIQPVRLLDVAEAF